jgi:hypothetical protein
VIFEERIPDEVPAEPAWEWVSNADRHAGQTLHTEKERARIAAERDADAKIVETAQYLTNCQIQALAALYCKGQWLHQLCL